MVEGVGRNGRVARMAGAEDVRVAGDDHLRRTTGGACAAMKASTLQRYGPEPLGDAPCHADANHVLMNVMVGRGGQRSAEQRRKRS